MGARASTATPKAAALAPWKRAALRWIAGGGETGACATAVFSSGLLQGLVQMGLAEKVAPLPTDPLQDRRWRATVTGLQALKVRR